MTVFSRLTPRRRPRRHGGAAIEFAIVAPVFFTFTFGCIEFARVNMLRNTAEVAATEGARAGVIPGATAAQCIAEAENELQILGSSGHKITVTPPVLTSDTETIRVAINIPLDVANGYVLTPFFLGKSISSAIELKLEK